MKIGVILLAICVGLYITDKICLWLERKGLLFYRHNKPEGGVIGSTLLELQNMVNPSTRHIIEIKDHAIETELCDDDKDAIIINEIKKK